MRNFSPGAEEVLKVAREGAAELNHPYVGTEHVLWAFSYAPGMEQELGLKPDQLRNALGEWFKLHPQSAAGANQLSRRLKNVLAMAKKEAASRKHPWVMPEHILYQMWADSRGAAGIILNRFKVPFRKINAIVNALDFYEECGGPDAPDSLAKAIMGKAQALARTFKNAEVWPEHLILAMIYGPSEYRLGCALNDFYLVEKLTQELETRLDLLSVGTASAVPPSESVKKLFLQALTLSAQCPMAEKQVFPCEPIHFLVAIMEWEPTLLPLDLNKIRESMAGTPHAPFMDFVRKLLDPGSVIEAGHFLQGFFDKRFKRLRA